MNQHFRIYTDGSSIGNPGPGAGVRSLSKETRDVKCSERFPGRLSRKWNFSRRSRHFTRCQRVRESNCIPIQSSSFAVCEVLSVGGRTRDGGTGAVQRCSTGICGPSSCASIASFTFNGDGSEGTMAIHSRLAPTRLHTVPLRVCLPTSASPLEAALCPVLALEGRDAILSWRIRDDFDC